MANELGESNSKGGEWERVESDKRAKMNGVARYFIDHKKIKRSGFTSSKRELKILWDATDERIQNLSSGKMRGRSSKFFNDNGMRNLGEVK